MTHRNGTPPADASPARLRDLGFEAAVATIRDYAIFLLDASGHIQTWNEGAQAIKGYSADEIIGSHFSRFYPQERIDHGWPAYELKRASEDGRFEDYSWRVRKDGSLFWANVVITAVRDKEDRLLGFVKVTRDFTERRAHEQELKQSEERFRLLVDGVQDYAIFMLDPNGRVATWNAGATNLKGYQADEIIGSHISRFYEPEAVKRAWPNYELKTATAEGRFEDEGWRVRKDGSRFWANVIITALRDRTGSLVGFSKITRDLTERKEHERQIADSEERFRLLVEGVTDYAIVMLDHGGAISSWNGGAAAITGYGPAEIMGKHFSHLYTSEDVRQSTPWRQLVQASEKGRASDEGWRVRKDGSQFWASAAITALYDSEGQHRGYVQVMQDLTERRHAENLAETSKRMHEFIAMLAHELRNPLAPIRNAVELMAKKGLIDPTLEAMRAMIDRQSAHLVRIIDELLDVNRIARGQFSVGKEPVDLNEVITRSVEASQPLMDSHEHQLVVELPENPIVIHGDTLRLTQALINLLNNAARYTPNGGRISISAETRETDVVLRVRDNGRGISRDDLERIFDLFTQVDPANAEQRGGLGVGLALVRRVVELHAGTVRASSEGLGKGSEFTVRLPLPLEQLELVVHNPTPTASALPRLRIVVADDNKDAADSLHMLLQSLGQDVYTVYDGRTALHAVERLKPHIVMLDIGMPGMSGYEVAERVKALRDQDAPVLVAVTGWGQNADKEEAFKRGFNFHFTKPVSAVALREALEKVSAGGTARA